MGITTVGPKRTIRAVKKVRPKRKLETVKHPSFGLAVLIDRHESDSGELVELIFPNGDRVRTFLADRISPHDGEPLVISKTMRHIISVWKKRAHLERREPAKSIPILEPPEDTEENLGDSVRELEVGIPYVEPEEPEPDIEYDEQPEEREEVEL